LAYIEPDQVNMNLAMGSSIGLIKK